ncbi:hypothetical protein H0H81_002465 [Sphagnurus paluster]|uniref:Uncharacterized protein n=1 Tax=Sphagnurus paluster TaxID=117069 RepID=A0A9P7FQE4_9AGAR|nr:hypothetical protein H0H81_002465 [Sphagnurus paluster]
MSDTDQIAPFYGEEDDGKENDEKIRYFELSLKDGGPASQWFLSLTTTEKQTWTTLANTFKNHWPAKTASTKTKAELQAELNNTKITEEELGKKVNVGGIKVYSHIAWADKVERLAKAIQDDGNLLVQNSRDNMASSLKSLVPHSNNTWTLFCQFVWTVSLIELRKKKDECACQKKIEDDLNAIKGARAPAATAKPVFPPASRVPVALPTTSSAFGLPRATPAPFVANNTQLNPPFANTAPRNMLGRRFVTRTY